jgi:hypothetical protein
MERTLLVAASDAGKAKRIEFTPTTRRDLRERAGTLCSYRRCLKPTLLPIAKKDGSGGIARIGEAAHIYGAIEGGPRWKVPALSEAEIKDIENGVWMCCHHGRQVDAAESEHTAEALMEMKRVREFAQRLTLTDSLIHSLAPYMPALVLDEVVWQHLPNLEVEKVGQAVIAAGLPYLPGYNAPLGTTMPPLPATFALTPLASVVKVASAATVEPLSSSDEVDRQVFVDARLRAVQIVTGWAQAIPPKDRDRVTYHLHDCYVKLTARHPDTGEICDAFIWTQACTSAFHQFSVFNGESLDISVSFTENPVNDLDWQLSISVGNGRYEAKSILQAFGPIMPKDIQNSQEWADFEGYVRVIDKLAQGWDPIGFISQRGDGCDDLSAIHPAPFPIMLQVSNEALVERQYRCKKVRLARELSDQWGRRFAFTDDYFDHALDETIIRAASVELQRRMGPFPYLPAGRTEPLVAIGAREIRFVSRNGAIGFESNAIRR